MGVAYLYYETHIALLANGGAENLPTKKDGLCALLQQAAVRTKVGTTAERQVQRFFSVGIRVPSLASLVSREFLDGRKESILDLRLDRISKWSIGARFANL